jgi:hypothetical protein
VKLRSLNQETKSISPECWTVKVTQTLFFFFSSFLFVMIEDCCRETASWMTINWLCFKGCHAEYVCVDERIVGHKPKSLSFREAAAEPLTVLTAWEAIVEGMHVPVPSGDCLYFLFVYPLVLFLCFGLLLFSFDMFVCYMFMCFS